MITPISLVIPYFIENENVYLWVQKRSTQDDYQNLLEFPGGKIEANETPKDAAIREVLEETTCVIQKDQLIKWQDYWVSIKQKDVVLKVFLFNDKTQQFPKSGYYGLDQLIDMSDSIPPKNREILSDMMRFIPKNSIILAP